MVRYFPERGEFVMAHMPREFNSYGTKCSYCGMIYYAMRGTICASPIDFTELQLRLSRKCGECGSPIFERFI